MKCAEIIMTKKYFVLKMLNTSNFYYSVYIKLKGAADIEIY